ncbi:MAG: methyltransferase [Pseudomonadota bacterium]
MNTPNILEELMGFMKTRIVLTAGDLDFFTKIQDAPKSDRDLAHDLNIDAHAASRILACLAAFGLIKKENDHYYLTEAGEPLSAHHPDTLLPMIRHMSTMWDNWTQLTRTVQQGVNAGLKPVINAPDIKNTNDFIGAMQVIGKDLAREIAADYSLKQYHCLLDIGGGSGIYTVAFLEKNSHLKAVLFDLPAVIPMAQECIGRAGLLRVGFVAGDFYTDELPPGCDIALLSAIIHQNTPEENMDLFRKIYRALDPCGCVLIRDHIMSESRMSPPAGAVFAINMLVHTKGGDTYTFSEVQKMLEQAGFKDIKLVRTGEKMDCLVVGKKPS